MFAARTLLVSRVATFTLARTPMKLSERAWQCWPLLTFAARNRQLLTYDLVARHSGMHVAGLGAVLEQVQSYCMLNGLPPLTAIVVRKESGQPSGGFSAATDVPRAFMQVFEHDWLATHCPLPDDLAEATRLCPSNGKAPMNRDGTRRPTLSVI